MISSAFGEILAIFSTAGFLVHPQPETCISMFHLVSMTISIQVWAVVSSLKEPFTTIGAAKERHDVWQH